MWSNPQIPWYLSSTSFQNAASSTWCWMACVKPVVPWAFMRTWRRAAAVSAIPPVPAVQVPCQMTVRPAPHLAPNSTRVLAPRTASLVLTMKLKPWNVKVGPKTQGYLHLQQHQYNSITSSVFKMITIYHSNMAMLTHTHVSFDHVQNVIRLALAAPARTQTSAHSARRDWCWIRTRCCVAWLATQTAHRGPTCTITSSPAWAATATVTLVRGQATMNARHVSSPNTYTVSFGRTTH